MALQFETSQARGAGQTPLWPWVVGPDGRPALAKQATDGQAPSPFEVLGIAPALDLNTADVALKVRSLIRELHPDRFYREGAQAVADAQRHTALVNDAWRTLRHVDRRIQWFLDTAPDAGPTALPPAVTLAMFEHNETLDEWLPNRQAHAAQLTRLADELALERNALTDEAQALALQWDQANLDGDEAKIPKFRNRLRAIFGHRAYLDNLLARIAGQA